MNEKNVLKTSLKIFIIGLIICIIPSIMSRSIIYISGLTLGYVVSVLTFLLIIKTSTLLLQIRSNTIVIISFLTLLKTALYASGFLIALLMPEVANIVTVFIGYFIIKVTIYYSSYRSRGGVTSE